MRTSNVLELREKKLFQNLSYVRLLVRFWRKGKTLGLCTPLLISFASRFPELYFPLTLSNGFSIAISFEKLECCGVSGSPSHAQCGMHPFPGFAPNPPQFFASRFPGGVKAIRTFSGLRELLKGFRSTFRSSPPARPSPLLSPRQSFFPSSEGCVAQIFAPFSLDNYDAARYKVQPSLCSLSFLSDPLFPSRSNNVEQIEAKSSAEEAEDRTGLERKASSPLSFLSLSPSEK